MATNRFGKQLLGIRESDKKYQRNRRKLHPEISREYQRKWYLNNKEKASAESKIRDLVRRNKLKRGKCRDCERIDTHGHHPDYSKPLEVIWLCPVHHKLEHLRNKMV